MDLALDRVDPSVVDLDEVAKRVDADHVARRELQRLELSLASRPEHLDALRQDPVLGHDGVHLGFGPFHRRAESAKTRGSTGRIWKGRSPLPVGSDSLQ